MRERGYERKIFVQRRISGFFLKLPKTSQYFRFFDDDFWKVAVWGWGGRRIGAIFEHGALGDGEE